LRAWRVNADYESELFHPGFSSKKVNEFLEFLVLFLEDRPLFSQKKYTSSYLKYVESITKRKPEIVSYGEYDNWWGILQDRELEKKLNSKMTSFEVRKSLIPLTNSFLISNRDDLFELSVKFPLLAKSLAGMSGRGHKVFDQRSELESYSQFPYLLEPLKKRIKDFSAYVSEDKKVIFYENFIDHKFQYKGSLFRNHFDPTLENLSFFEEVDLEEWKKYQENLTTIMSYYNSFKLTQGYSIDSFVYEDDSKKMIYPLCEVNYRKTMGYVCYSLAKKYAAQYPWCLFLLKNIKSSLAEMIFSKIKELKNVILLSPADVRFQMFFLFAENESQGREVFRELERLLANDGEFSINI